MKTKLIILIFVFALLLFCRHEKALLNREEYKIVNNDNQLKNQYNNQEHLVLNSKKYD